jgi:cell division protein FtsN
LNIPDFIKIYLREHDQLTVPRIGTFVTRYKSARVNELVKVVNPPSKEISFSDKEKEDDDVLNSFVAQQLNINREEAKNKVTDYVNTLLDQLQKGKIVQIADLGLLSLKGEQIVFSPLIRENLLPDSFGLGEVRFDIETQPQPKVEKTVIVENKQPAVAKQSEKSKPTKVKAPKPEKVKPEPRVKTEKNRKISWRWVLLGTATPLIILLLAYLFFFTDIPSQLKLFSKKTDNQVVAKDTIAKVETVAKADTNAIKADTTVIDSSKMKADTTTKKVVVDTKESVIVSQVIDDQVNKKKALQPNSAHRVQAQKTKPARQTRYYLVAGSFKNLINAQKFKDELHQKGYPSEMFTEDRIFKVAYQSFTTKEEAQKKLNELSKKGIKSVWVAEHTE